jgi:hypothetical protein
MRGGPRRRYVIPGDVPVWIGSGRWGPRRVHVGECLAVLAAELVYHQMVCNGDICAPGHRAAVTWTATPKKPRAVWSIEVEVQANAVWRCGRLFLRCPACQRRATRLYVPREDLPPRCRRCWGLSYQSQSWSYRRTGPMDLLFGSAAQRTTEIRRERRKAAAEARYAEKRRYR